jgi:hypothetical protein
MNSVQASVGDERMSGLGSVATGTRLRRGSDDGLGGFLRQGASTPHNDVCKRLAGILN